jgi:hypothetical protein
MIVKREINFYWKWAQLASSLSFRILIFIRGMFSQRNILQLYSHLECVTFTTSVPKIKAYIIFINLNYVKFGQVLPKVVNMQNIKSIPLNL